MATMIEPTPELLARVALLGEQAQADVYAQVSKFNVRIEAMLLRAESGRRLEGAVTVMAAPNIVAQVWGYSSYAELKAHKFKHGGMPAPVRARGQVYQALVELGLRESEVATVLHLDRASVYYHTRLHAHRVKFEHEYRTRWWIVIRKLTENGLLKAQAPVHGEALPPPAHA